MTLRETEGEEESWKKQERSMASKRKARLFFSFLTPPSTSPRDGPTKKKQDQLSALLDGHFTAPGNKKDKNKNEKK